MGDPLYALDSKGLRTVSRSILGGNGEPPLGQLSTARQASQAQCGRQSPLDAGPTGQAAKALLAQDVADHVLAGDGIGPSIQAGLDVGQGLIG